jgi:hypothetical protein
VDNQAPIRKLFSTMKDPRAIRRRCLWRHGNHDLLVCVPLAAQERPDIVQQPIATQSGPVSSRSADDATARWYRWLLGGLHRIDFTAWMRARPAWDIIMLTLMLGGLRGGLFYSPNRLFRQARLGSANKAGQQHYVVPDAP